MQTTLGRRSFFLSCLVMVSMLLVPSWAEAGALDDPYLWLEEVDGEAALRWVQEQNEKTWAFLRENAEAYEPLYARLLEVLTSDERIPYPTLAGDYVDNFWMDESYPRGLWRRASLESFIAGQPEWEHLLDMTALGESEGVNWSFGGTTCLPPAYERCLVYLSEGGADATEVREFDVRSRSFVPGGFYLPAAKMSVTWVDENSLLVATDWGEGTLTASGYPSTVKKVERGVPLSEAVTVFQSELTHMGVTTGTVRFWEENIPVVFHAKDFFHRESYLVLGSELIFLDIPGDAGWLLLADQIVILLGSDWHVGDTSYREGSVIAANFEAFLNGDGQFQILFTPADRVIVSELDATADYLLISVLNNVSSELYRLHYVEGTGAGEGTDSVQDRASSRVWGDPEQIPLAEFGAAAIISTSRGDNRAFLSFSSLLQPSTVYLMEDDGSLRQIAQLPHLFDAERLVVEQYEATSRDGTAVPYFVVRREDFVFDGANPTLLWGYGGFKIPVVPEYGPLVGAGWLEGSGSRGRVYVLANIRGGGEFGPGWHRAALRENRQRAYGDFIAVAEDLMGRGITSPKHLGILGASNGGLLTGVALTQRPDLFGAVVSAVPLLDMRRYHLLLAGASWMAEYGDPDRPEDWAFISRYSPYHNVHRDRSYPPVLFVTSTRDDRVHPGHARKMAAKMLSMGRPVYYYEPMEGGHGGAVTPEQQAELWATMYTFLWIQLE